MAAKEMSPDNFKKNFIESYIGNIKVQDKDEQKKIINLRRKVAESIAMEIISNTESLVKSSGISNSSFAYAVLATKLKVADGYKELLSSDGKPINIEKLNTILGKEIKQQILEHHQKEEDKKSDPFLEAMLENERLKEEEIKEKIKQIDFNNLSTEDLIIVLENIPSSLIQMTEVEVKRVFDELYDHQDDSVKADGEKMILIYQKMLKKQQLTEEEKQFVDAFGKEHNYQFNDIDDFFKQYGENIEELALIMERIRMLSSEKGEITEQDVVIFEDPRYKQVFEQLGMNREIFISNQIIKNKEEIEKKQGVIIKIPQSIVQDDKLKPMIEIFEEINHETNYEEASDINFDDIDFEEHDFSGTDVFDEFGSGFAGLAKQGEILPDDITSEMIEEFVDIQAQEYYTSPELVSEQFIEEQPEAGQVAQDVVQPETEEQETVAEIDFQATQVQQDQVESEQASQEEKDKKIETMEEEAKDGYDPKDNEVEAKEKPLKKFFSRIYNAVTRKNKPALDAPQMQAEASLKQKAFDAETDGHDFSDMGVVPTSKIIQSQILKFAKGLKKLVSRDNQEKTESTVVNQPNQLVGTIDSFVVSDDVKQNVVAVGKQAKQIQEQKRYIPQNVKNAGTRDDEEGLSLDE